MGIHASVIARLETLKYPVTEADQPIIEYNITKAEAELKASTNRSEIPEGLNSAWVDMAAGMFLADKKAAGALNCIYDFEAPAKSISEGDTSVTFAIADTGSFEDQFDAMLARMVSPAKNLICAFRRLSW